MASSSVEFSDEFRDDVLLEASTDYGLWISWQGGSVRMEFLLDESQSDLHPHIHTPQLTNTHIVKGGGSGATVFEGNFEDKKFIWKHGDYKDMRDVFALAEIEHELLERATFAPEDAENLLSRIPRFAGVFISPAAFRVRPGELWESLRKTIIKWNAVKEEEAVAASNGLPRPVSRQDLRGELYRRIKLFEGETDIHVLRREVRIAIENCIKHDSEEQVICDYEGTKLLVDALVRLQAKHVWKFSVAQVAIGGDTPRTGSSLLTSGELRGQLLNDLLDQFMGVLRSLRAVTTPEETEAVEEVREEVDHLKEDATPADISRLADSFVGSAIVKNWHPEKGRYKIAKDLGATFRGEEGNLVLTTDEKMPAKILGDLLGDLRTHLAYEVFDVGPCNGAAFYEMHIVWKDLLKEATHLKSKAATECVWTCGLTDAGLHNMFFSDGRLWLFDLGKPNYQPLPAFLTKYLMSFFHCLGMQDTPDGKTWVNRFQVSDDGNMLELTGETKKLLPMAHEAYNIALDRLVNEIFDGEEAVRDVMVKYSVLQILSDAAFCLRKWQIKGGGAPTYGDENHNKGLEKWLWRAIWDIWVATDVSSTYLSWLSKEHASDSMIQASGLRLKKSNTEPCKQ